MKKIGLVTEPLNAYGCGIKTYAQSIINEIIKQNNGEFNFVGVNYRKIDNIEMEQIVIRNPFERLWKTYLWYPYMVRKIDVLGFDLIHCLDQVPTFFKTKTKRIMTVHDLSPILFPEQHKTGKSFIYRKLFPRTMANTDKIISVSGNTKKDLMKIYKVPEEKIKVVYEAAGDWFKLISEDDLNKFRKAKKLPDKYIFALANLEPRKNLERVIKAFSKARIDQNVWLLIGGAKGWKYDKIFEVYSSSLKKDRIKFIGFVKEKELPYYYNLAKMLIYPSLYEGFGLPIVEAMKCGCPVLTSSVSSMPEIGGEAVIKVNPEDTSEITNGIEMINNITKLEDLSKKGLEKVKEFDWQKATKKTIKIYKEVLS